MMAPTKVLILRISFLTRTDPWAIGMIHTSRQIMSTQFHPEAKGGPLDSSFLFDSYLSQVEGFKNEQARYEPSRSGRPNPLLVDLLSKQRVGVVPENVLASVGKRAETAKSEIAATAA
jgi:carbamoyl-phosphate synthase small subunit